MQNVRTTHQIWTVTLPPAALAAHAAAHFGCDSSRNCQICLFKGDGYTDNQYYDSVDPKMISFHNVMAAGSATENAGFPS